jgi:hypothetical protein
MNAIAASIKFLHIPAYPAFLITGTYLGLEYHD